MRAGEEPSYLQQLKNAADAAVLHEQREWHLLLHYRTSMTGRHESEVDEPGFFLSEAGKTDPKAELQATLAYFFSTELVGRSRQPARCAFVARYHWLKHQLAIDESRLPPVQCERFRAWLTELNPESITLIFPSAYMNNPSSMFGHLLLRVDQKGQTENTRILAYTINYAADVTTENGILFAVLGATGGFKGYFSTMPYYMKAKEYGDFENRDIWEYRLNLNQEQIQRLLMHAWELGNASFDYFFFKENCAYEILSLLDVADPKLHLTERFWLYTFPTDAIRLITQTPELVSEITFRPSRSTKVRRGREALSAHERAMLGKIVMDPAMVESATFTALPPESQARVLDVASDYVLYRSATDEERSSIYGQRNRLLLLARSKLEVDATSNRIVPFTGPPEQGHKIRRAGLAAGYDAGEPFLEFNFRPAFHDLMDPGYGYTPDAQIELLAVSLRHYWERKHTRLERFTFANIVSLSPVDALFRRPSWKLAVGLETTEHNGCRFCHIGNLEGGIGLSTESRLFNREVYFGFVQLAAEYGPVFHHDHRFGGGATIGVLADMTDRWKFSVSGTYLGFPIGEKSHDWRFSALQRFTLRKDLAARLEFRQRDRKQEYLLGLQLYF